MADVIAGIDIGGTKVGITLGTIDGKMFFTHFVPTRVELGPHRILDQVMKKINEMLLKEQADLVAVGVGCGGPLDIERGLVMSPPNLPGWHTFPIVEIIRERLGVPVYLENDANAAALGEYIYGAGRGYNDIVYITISTGIGGGIIINGKLVRGLKSGAGEIGHLIVMPNGPKCGCGTSGCLEAICSGTNIARRARERLVSDETIGNPSILNTYSQITAKTVIAAAKAGDHLACEIWEETIHYLAIGISNVIVTVAPQAIILGGGVLASGEYLLTPLRAAIRQHVNTLSVERLHIRQAALRNKSGVYGAVMIALLMQETQT